MKRGNGWAVIVDAGKHSARRCAECRHRVWARDHAGNACPRCAGELGPIAAERRQIWKQFTRKRDAEDWLADKVSTVAGGGDAVPRKLPTYGVYVEGWLQRRASKIRPRSLARYRDLLDRYALPTLRDLRLDEVRRDDVQAVLDAVEARGLAPRTIAQCRAVLNASFKDAFENELIARNPVTGTKIPKREKYDVEVLRPEHVVALLGHASGSDWEMPLLIGAHTGARRSEVLALRWSDVDLDARRLTIRRSLHATVRDKSGADQPSVEYHEPKTTRSRRTVTITPSLAERLRSYRIAQTERRLALGAGWQDGDLICDDGSGAPVHPDSFSQAFKRLAKQAGLPARARLHDLRHACAVLLAIEGVPMEAVSAQLGHSSAGFTLNTYRHVVDEMTAAAAAAIERRLAAR